MRFMLKSCVLLPSTCLWTVGLLSWQSSISSSTPTIWGRSRAFWACIAGRAPPGPRRPLPVWLGAMYQWSGPLPERWDAAGKLGPHPTQQRTPDPPPTSQRLWRPEGGGPGREVHEGPDALQHQRELVGEQRLAHGGQHRRVRRQLVADRLGWGANVGFA